MVEHDRRCVECDETMERGFMLDSMNRIQRRPLEWIEGDPQSGLLGDVKTTGRLKREVVVYRCPSCGLLKHYAN
jgi:hypothetical protein